MKSKLTMNKTGQNAMVLTLLGVLVVAIVAGMIAYFAGFGPQQTFGGEDGEGGTPIGLEGKSASLAVSVTDDANADKTTAAAVPLYLLAPASNGGTAKLVYSGGTSSSSAAGTATLTDGVAVSNSKYQLWGFNNTYAMANIEPVEVTVNSESARAEVKVMLLPSKVGLTVFDENDAVLDADALNNYNVTLGANDATTLARIKIENNESNTGLWVYGVFANVSESTDIKTLSIGSTYSAVTQASGSPGALNLGRSNGDDFSWKLSSPTRLYDFDSLSIGPLKIESKGTDPSDDEFQLAIVDASHFRSSVDTNSIMFGAENDAATPADVGMNDFFIQVAVN